MEIEKFETIVMRLKGKRVLFIATKNIDYLRITQEQELLEKYAQKVDFLVSARGGYFARILEVLSKLLFHPMKAYDVIFVGFQAQFIIPLFYWKLRKKEIWSDFFISLYDTLVFDRKKVREHSPIAWLAKKVDRYTLKKSDAVICDTMAHGTYFCREFDIPQRKMYVLYLKADTTIYYPRIVDKCDEYKGKFVVFYFGSILPLQGVEVILEAAKLLEDKTDILFVIVGPIRKKTGRDDSSSNVKLFDWLTQAELAEQIAQADLCLAGHFNSQIEKAKRTIPGKTYIYEAMHKPMVLGDNEANRELFTADELHNFVEMGNAAALAAKIMEVRNGLREHL